MLLIGVAIVFAVLIWFYWSYCYDNRIRSTGAVTICCFLALIMLVSFIVGLTIPVAGYEEPELIETRVLMPIESQNAIEKEENPIYLIVELKEKNNHYMYCHYRYCVEKDGRPRTYVERGDVRIVYDEHNEPVIESYVRKAKKTIFSLNWGATEKYYVVITPKSGVLLNFPKST